MKFKKILLPFIAGALALGLAACGEDDKAKKDETPQEQKGAPQEGAPDEATQEEAAKKAKEMQEKLAKQQVDAEEIVAVVNDEELKGEQYNAALQSIQGQMQQMGQDPSSEENAELVKVQALDTLVNQTLILQNAKEAEIKATESEVDEEYSKFSGQFEDEKAMKEALKEQKLDEKKVKALLAESIVFGKYQDKVAPVEEVTEEEIKEYYDEVAAQAKEAEQELPPLEELSEEIKGMLEQEKQQKLLLAHVEELKADAEIEFKI